MNGEQTERAIAVMQSWVNGGDIQWRAREVGSLWMDELIAPLWDWKCNEYRKKPQPVEVVVYALIELETGRICSYHVTEAMADACLVELRRCGRNGVVIQCKGTCTCDT